MSQIWQIIVVCWLTYLVCQAKVTINQDELNSCDAAMHRRICPTIWSGFHLPHMLTSLSLRGGSRKGRLKATDEDRANVEGIELTAEQERNLRRHWKRKPEFLTVKKGGIEKSVKTSSILKVMKDKSMLEQRQRERTPLQLIDLGEQGLQWVRKVEGIDMQEKFGSAPIRLMSNLTEMQSEKLQQLGPVLQGEDGYRIAKETRPKLFNQLSLSVQALRDTKEESMAQSKGIVPKDGMEVIDQVETHVLVAGTKPEDAIQHLGSHTYGEISPSSFAEILCLVQPKEGEIFVDLGSGTGKAVLLAASLFPFSESIGIEFVEPLHKAALRLQQSFWTMVAERKTTFAATEIGKISFKLDDAMAFDWWSRGDVVFAANTCWTDEMNDTLIKRMEKLRVGARAITMTRPLDLDKESWVLRHKIVREYGRGKMTFFLFEKFAMSPQKTAKDTR